jgi:hypothetical protein
MLMKSRTLLIITAAAALLFTIFAWKSGGAILSIFRTSNSSNLKIDDTNRHAGILSASQLPEPRKTASDISTSEASSPRTGGTTSENNQNKIRPTPNGILGGGNFRKLAASEDLTNLDYAWRRLAPICNMSLKQAAEREKALAKLKLDVAEAQKPAQNGSLHLSLGNASYEQKASAFDRFYELCNKSFAGVPLTSKELDVMALQPGLARFRAIGVAANAEKAGLSSLEIKTALETVVTTPMYDTLQGILLTRLDVSPLAAHYSQEQLQSLTEFAAQIIVCRMGDDCGADGYTTLFTCRLNGICGNSFEDAVMDHLKDRKIDTTALRQFIDQRQQALNLLDFSILKKPK